MTEKPVDRRVQRTRGLLRDALMDLVHEKEYDTITIEEITERANLGRTTFYLHYQSKDDLLLDHFADFMAEMNLDRLSREQLLGMEPQPELVAFLGRISEGKAVYRAFTQAKDAGLILRNIRERMVENLGQSLAEAFPGSSPNLPVDILTNYIVGAQLSLIDWWIIRRVPYPAAEVAAMLHRLQVVAVRDAYGL